MRREVVDTMARKLSAARCEIGRLNGQIRDMRGAHTRRCQEMAERLRAESARADRAEEAARRLADAAAATTHTLSDVEVYRAHMERLGVLPRPDRHA